MKKQEYQEVVNRIIQAITSGVKPWVPRFDRPAIGRPQNFFTKNKYHGVNATLLCMEAYEQKYSSNSWLTYKQVSELKGKIRKGERATKVFFFNYVEKKADDSNEPDDEARVVPCWKCFNVFNLDQTEGVTEPENAGNLPSNDFISNLTVDALVRASQAVIKHSNKRSAYYHTGNDYIHLPYEKHFRSVDAYYATLLHELVHWTGHTSRLDRFKVASRYGDESYAFEELTAELGAAFLSLDLNVRSDIENHASYLNGWATLLNDKYLAFFKAASLAEKASQYLYSLTNQVLGEQLPLFEEAA